MIRHPYPPLYDKVVLLLGSHSPGQAGTKFCDFQEPAPGNRTYKQYPVLPQDPQKDRALFHRRRP